jgi:hypothetical protein
VSGVSDGAGGFVPGPRIEQWYPLSSGSSYYESGFATVWAQIGSQTAFTNSCEECSNYIDNGAGLSWTVYSLPQAPIAEHVDLGDAEFALRSAVRSAADALGALRAEAGGLDVADPRKLVEQVMESSGQHRAPDHAPSRALRVLENAAHIDAIVTVSSGLMPIGLQSSSEAQIANEALRPLSAVVRSARLAAISAILMSAWR